MSTHMRHRSSKQVTCGFWIFIQSYSTVFGQETHPENGMIVGGYLYFITQLVYCLHSSLKTDSSCKSRTDWIYAN